MSLIAGFRALLSFLTIIPVGTDQQRLEDAANYIFLAPSVGAIIGLLAGLLSLLLRRALPDILSGLLTLGFLLLITGVHHTDGLLDFADGLMCQGSADRKIQAMKDNNTGAAGLSLGIIILASSAAAISYIPTNVIVGGLISAEVSAKLSLVILAWRGRSAIQGTNTYFVEAMHRKDYQTRLFASLMLSTGIALIALQSVGIVALLVSSLTALALNWLSNRHFNGLTGDVFGASNDLTRLMALLVIVAIL